MTRWGIITCPEPLETGWDNTPRLDRGPVLALDMNSYLLLQMRACVEMAHMIGDDIIASKARAMADKHAARMVELLYDEKDNIFRDVLVTTGEKLPIKTPACFLPLLAGVPIDDTRARRMIEDYLLNPKLFFGKVPFPSVAYEEPTYQPENWWRGPTWIAVAYLMLEVLRRYGYAAQAREAAQRLYTVMIADGDLRELFNSQTGEGMGAHQQGWTAAICLRLKMELVAGL
jgi:glycogen debranching enzyme